MHPRTEVSRGTVSEYTRRRRSPEKPVSSGARDFTTEWQAWVSERVTTMLSSGAMRPPSNFAQLADQVQQEFEAWWCREWRPLQEQRAAAAAVLGHGGTPANVVEAEAAPPKQVFKNSIISEL